MKKEELNLMLEVGQITALMSGEGRMDRLYEIIHEKLDVGGINDTAYTMAWFATEFIDKYKDTDWEAVVMDEVKLPYLSKEFQSRGQHISCWDEAAEDYAQFRVENFTYEEFSKINHGKTKNPLLK